MLERNIHTNKRSEEAITAVNRTKIRVFLAVASLSIQMIQVPKGNIIQSRIEIDYIQTFLACYPPTAFPKKENKQGNKLVCGQVYLNTATSCVEYSILSISMLL